MPDEVQTGEISEQARDTESTKELSGELEVSESSPAGGNRAHDVTDELVDERLDNAIYGLMWLVVFVGIPVYIVLRITVL